MNKVRVTIRTCEVHLKIFFVQRGLETSSAQFRQYIKEARSTVSLKHGAESQPQMSAVIAERER